MKSTIHPNKILTLLVVLISILSSCNKVSNFDLGNRKELPSELQLKEVTLLNGQKYQSYEYDDLGRVKSLFLNSVDRFIITYEGNLLFPNTFNNYTCKYDQNHRLIAVEGEELSQATIEYSDRKINIIQRTRPITTSPALLRTDTLSLQLNNEGIPISAQLLPKGIEYAFNHDQNPNAYTSVQKVMFPLLLIYPLEDVLSEIVIALSKENLLRIYQTSTSVSAGTEKPIIIDYSYRFDHFLYDIPTTKSSYGTKNEQFTFKYNK